MTKKDPGLLFHFHVLNMFKSWSNLGFDQDSNGHKNSKKIPKNEKPKHIVFLCHIVSIQVDKQGLDTYSNKTNHVSIPLTPKLYLMKSTT